MKSKRRKIKSWSHHLHLAAASGDVAAIRQGESTARRVRCITPTPAVAEEVLASGGYPKLRFPHPGMKLGQAEVQNGIPEAGQVAERGRRWTPAYAVDWEDEADLGYRIRYPSSCGSVVGVSDLRRGYTMQGGIDD